MKQSLNERFLRAQRTVDTLPDDFSDLWPLVNEIVPKEEQERLYYSFKGERGKMELRLTKMHALLVVYICRIYKEELLRDAAYLKFLSHIRSNDLGMCVFLFNLYEGVHIPEFLNYGRINNEHLKVAFGQIPD